MTAPLAARAGTRAVRLAVVAALCTAALAAAGCKKKKPPPPAEPPHLAGLAAIPADVRAVIGVDVKALSQSWLVDRALEQMFLRAPELRLRTDRLLRQCRIDPARDLDGFLIGLGGPQGRDAVMVVTGRLSEPDIVRCVGKRAQDEGGRLVSTPAGGRTRHAVTPDPKSETLWFSFVSPTSVVVTTSPDWLDRAVGDGLKVTDDVNFGPLLARVDRTAGLWAAGLVDAAIGAGLVGITGGKVAAPPQALYLWLRPQAGVTAELSAVMASVEDANQLKTLVKSQIGLGALALQQVRLGPLLQKVVVASEGDVVRLSVNLSRDDLKDLLARIDTAPVNAQNPASGVTPKTPETPGTP